MILFWNQHHADDDVVSRTDDTVNYYINTTTSYSSPTTRTTTTTTETIIMIPQQNDDGQQQRGRPDPNVWNQLSKAWTDMNGTNIKTKSGDILKNKDKHLSKLIRQQPNDDNNNNNGTTPTTFFCSPTSLLKLIIITTTTTTTTSSNNNNNKSTTVHVGSSKNSSSSSTWILTSFDSNGNIKTIGGDEFYITYSEQHHHHQRDDETATLNNNENNNNYPNNNNNTKAVAYSIDRGDGSYLLDFVSPPSLDANNKINNKVNTTTSRNSSDATTTTTTTTTTGGGKDDDGGFLTIHFQYTCGLGQLPHGTKQKWRTGGSLMISYKDIPVPKLYPNDIRSFVIPNLLSHSKSKIDLGRYTKIIMYGDSNLQYLFLANIDQYTNLKFTSRPESSLSRQSMKRRFLPKITWFVNDTISKDKDDNQGKYALFIGSACWDIVFGKKVGPKFIYHLSAMKELLERIQQRFPTVDIYWHSGYALHIHAASTNLDWDNYREPLKYMSYSRSYQLYKQQLEVCQQLNITVLDFMDATYLLANHYQYGDARHVEPYISQLLLSWYYPNS